MLNIAADHDPRIAESFEAFHGSPHDFDRFDLSRIGTGEGAQSYGHGLYFAENEKVARGYQRATSDKAFVDKVATLYDEGFSPGDAWDEIKDHWSDFTPAEQRLMTALEKDDWLGFDYPHQAVSAALRDIKSFDVSPETAAAARAMGNMYRVKINASHEHFLDWDKPLAEQSERVKNTLKAAGFDDVQTGKDIYHALVKYRPDQGGVPKLRWHQAGRSGRDARGSIWAVGGLGHPRRQIPRPGIPQSGATAPATSSSSTTTTSKSPTRTANRSNARTSSLSTRWPGQRPRGFAAGPPPIRGPGRCSNISPARADSSRSGTAGDLRQ